MPRPRANGWIEKPVHTLVQYPEHEDVMPKVEKVAKFLAYCREVKPAGDFALRADFNAELLRPWIGYIMILEYLPEVRDFRYRMYGTTIADQAGFDLTGMTVSEFDADTGDFFIKLYQESLDKRALIFSVNSGTHSKFSCDWHRIICPVRHDGGLQIVACNYPKKRDAAD